MRAFVNLGYDIGFLLKVFYKPSAFILFIQTQENLIIPEFLGVTLDDSNSYVIRGQNYFDSPTYISKNCHNRAFRCQVNINSFKST